MPLTIESFGRIADKSWFSSRDIIVRGQGDQATARLGNYFFSQGSKANDETMAAFRSALEQKYGVFGLNAFDSIVGSRAQLHKALRVSDVKATLSRLEVVKKNHFVNELSRQLDTSPKFRELSEGLRKLVRTIISANPLSSSLSDCTTPADISRKASARIDEAIQSAKDFVEGKKQLNPNYDVSLESQPLSGRKMTETEAKSDEPTGLRNLKTVFKKGTTSVEDQIKQGTLGSGMRINRSNTNPVLLEKLKTNGVEPGFIYRNDWSKDDTHGYMANINSQESRAALDVLKENNSTLRAKCEGKDLRTQILLAGRAHPAAMAAASELVIEQALGAPNPNDTAEILTLRNALAEKLPPDVKAQLANGVSEPANQNLLTALKKDFFVEIRDAVMSVRPKNADGSKNSLYETSNVFRHFSDRGIVKLDYNEGSKFWKGDSAHAGTFMRPERIIVGRKMGQLYRFQTRTTADNASAGAVTEALANDLTRLAGVPSQELEIVRGQYSDGHPKLMLSAKFANGYKDMEAGMLKDGRVVPPKAPPDLEMEPLGKYKAFFLVTADRDGVGSRGQNKGFVNGKFFAIDPGHSLEGNGKYLKVSDDLSFKDTYGHSTKPRFKNFSVFDDDTRFAKFSGILDLREKAKAGVFDQLFDEYKAMFNPNEPGIKPEEKALREKIFADINKKQTEFNASLAKILRVGGMQLELYDALENAPQAVREGAIENLANLEKLFSPTTWVSKKGQVLLKHLEVIPESRVKWGVGMVGDNIVYHCDRRLDPKALALLRSIAESTGAKLDTDAMGVTRLVVPKDNAKQFFASFTEKWVQETTHPEEYQARNGFGDPLKAAKTYQPAKLSPIPPETGKPLDASQLPDELDIPIDGVVVKLPKLHFEDMATKKSARPRPNSIGELRAMMGARINRGNEILRALYSGNVSRFEATTENAAALTIALHVAALKKGEFMYRGSFSVADPQGNIARWLDSNPEIYQRTSTHAKPYQEMWVDGHLNMPRGLDVPTGMGGLLNGMRTFHYFSLPDTAHLEDAGGSGNNRRIFIKCETYGIFCSTAHFHPFNKADARSEGMQTRSYRFGDVIESIQHGGSLLVSKFTSKTASGIRKENLPTAVTNTIYDAGRALRKAGFPLVADHVLEGVFDGGGVKMFLDNLEREIKALPEGDDLRAMESIMMQLDAIDDAVRNLNGRIENRMGNEIMLDIHDFNP